MPRDIISIFLLCLTFFVSDSSRALHIHERLLLSRQISNGASHITMLVAIKEGQVSDFESFIRNKWPNAYVRYIDRDLGYMRLRVPTLSAIPISKHPSVVASQLSGTIPFMMNSPEIHAYGAISPKKMDLNFYHYLKNATPDSPVLGLGEIGIAQLREQHPNFDGRGVTVAVLEHFPDIGSPDLDLAKSITGTPIRKFQSAFSILGFEPDEPYESYEWKMPYSINFSVFQTSKKGLITTKGTAVRVPADGNYQTAIINEDDFADQSHDLNGDGNPHGTSRTLIIARKEGLNCILIDTNQNYDLRDEECIAEYNQDPRYHRFRSVSGRPVGPRFIITSSDDPNTWAIGIPNQHTHDVHIIIAGGNLFRSKITGAAPSASIVIYNVGAPRQEAIIESYIHASRNPNIDIIFSSIGNYGSFDTDASVQALILNRITKKRNKVIIFSPGNSENTVSSLSFDASASGVLAVGQYHSGDTRVFLTGSKDRKGIVPAVSSAGPTEDGRLKPDVVAPSLAVLPIASSITNSATEQLSMAVLCPNVIPEPGLHCFSGTSMSGPMGAGAVAVLVSAARQMKIPFTAEDVVNAVKSTARHIVGVDTYMQGHGLIHVPAALEWLKTRPARNRAEISLSAPVVTKLSRDLTVAGVGEGLYEREGWLPGTSGMRYVAIVRRSGDVRPIKYNLKIVGDHNATFSAAGELLIPFNKKFEIPVAIHPRKSGVHSAIMQLVPDGESKATLTVPLTVVAAAPLHSENNYKTTIRIPADPGGSRRFYVHVPSGTIALKIRVLPAVPNIRIMTRGPAGINSYAHFDKIRTTKTLVNPHAREASNNEQTVFHPSAGVWEIWIHEAHGARGETPYTATFEAIQNVTLARGATSEARQVGSPYKVRFTTGKIISGQVSLAPDDQPHLVELDLPPNAARIEARASVSGQMGDSTPLVSLMALECADKHCRARNYEVGAGETGIMVSNIGAAKWKLAIDSSRKEKASAVIDYELFISTNDGALRTADRGGLPVNGLKSNDKISGHSMHEIQCFKEIIRDDVRIVEAGNVSKSIDEKPFVTVVSETYVPLGRVVIESIAKQNIVNNTNCQYDEIVY